MGSTLDVKHYLILAIRSQIFEYLRETFYRHAFGVAKTGSFRKKYEKMDYA